MASHNIVYKQIVWDRLIAIVEEQAQTIIRTAFGTAAREAGDVSAAVFSVEGEMVAQAVTGTPGHVNSVANSIRYFLEEFPAAAMREGDVYITNDPWKATGHLFDVTIVTPVFDRGRLLCLVASNTHVADIGGMGVGPDATQIYHEGLFIPILKLYEAGRLVESVTKFIRANVRSPRETLGDIHALVSCNEVAARRFRALRAEYGLDDFADISRFILETSRRGMENAIARVPEGSWSNVMMVDGFDHPVRLQATLTVKDRRILVDFDGTSPAIKKALNVPLSYAQAYATFGIRCIIGPDIPNNTGSLSVIDVTGPKGCILNAQYPSAVTARATIGMMMPDLMFGCLRQVLPDEVPAESADSLWNIRLVGGQVAQNDSRPDGEMRLGKAFVQTTFTTGGMGARPKGDGLSATAFPSGVRNTSIEVMETMAPIRFWRKEFRQDSGGPGRHRGGLGQVVEVESTEPADLLIAATFDRVKFAPRGVEQGKDGSPGRLYLKSGKQLKAKGRQLVPANDRLIVETPGGGGWGDPKARDRQAVLADLREGYISLEAAVETYGLVDKG
ncbi:hydantoinase B/oxoprolinase family protein [Pigmentiphaga soli]|uniref:Hydantoinase B/oxoprolinase family protein n=1 Tax=Pigmentiphaga soli TaxID=1007095 RepID=A0ABP8GEE6_9BURK